MIFKIALFLFLLFAFTILLAVIQQRIELNLIQFWSKSFGDYGILDITKMAFYS